MTREQTIKYALKYLVHKQQEQGSWGYADNDNINKVPWDEVLEWIDQQPCGDCISRQAMLEVQIKYAEHMGATKYWQMRDDIRALPSVDPEIKTGKWIKGKCNRCGTLAPYWAMSTAYYCSDYCPECGAKMEEET